MSDNTPVGDKTTGIDEAEEALEQANDDNPLKGVVKFLLDKLDKVEMNQTGFGQAINNNQENIENIKNNSESPDSKGGGKQSASIESEILPIERLRQMREQDKEHPALPSNGRQSFDRALVIYEHYREWSSKAQAGRVIKSGLKNLIETATGERLYWSQVKRACAKLEEYSNGTIRLEKTKRHGNVLVAENQSVLAGGG